MYRRRRFLLLFPQAATLLAALLLAALLLASSGEVRGDALVVVRAMTAETVCEIFVEPGGVRTEVEIGEGDLLAFANVLPNDFLAKVAPGQTFDPLEDRLPRFTKEDWVVLADEEPLEGLITGLEARRRVKRDEITGEPLADAEDEAVLFLTLLHTSKAWRSGTGPRTITFRVSAPGGGAARRAEIGFVAYHGGIPVTDFRYLVEEMTLDLDWEDPWFSAFRHRNLRRTYDAPLSVFLYVDPFEVRKEVIVRPKDLQAWVDLGLEGKETIEAEVQGSLKEKVAVFLLETCPVTVDGVAVPPVLDRIHFIRRTLRTTGVIDPPEDLPTHAATLGVIFAYPILALPDHVELTWKLWSGRIEKIPAVATDEAGGLPSVLTPDDPVLVWQNFLQHPTMPGLVELPPPAPGPSLPLPSVVLALFGIVGCFLVLRCRVRPALLYFLALVPVFVVAWALLPVGRVPLPFGSPAPSADEARSVAQGLLRNVYAAFDRRGEEAIYDVLDRSVHGDLLRRTYLETRRSLVLENQGGARVKVKGVDVDEMDVPSAEKGGGFVSRCAWTVTGSVGHWGHIHQRRNRYEAILTVRTVDGAWKITDIELLDEKRL